MENMNEKNFVWLLINNGYMKFFIKISRKYETYSIESKGYDFGVLW